MQEEIRALLEGGAKTGTKMSPRVLSVLKNALSLGTKGLPILDILTLLQWVDTAGPGVGDYTGWSPEQKAAEVAAARAQGKGLQ